VAAVGRVGGAECVLAFVRLVRTDWIRVGAMVTHFGFAVTAIAAS
jgi:hypothetical protein